MINKNEYKGFSLFNDIEDAQLRNRNRAVVLTNLLEDNIDGNKKMSARGAALVLGYFLNVPKEERGDVKERFLVDATQRGFILESPASL